MSVDAVGAANARLVVLGWFAGLVYFGWWSPVAAQMPLLAWVLLAVVGMFATSLVIGAGLTILAAAATKLATGRPDGSTVGFHLVSWMAPPLAFWAAKYAIVSSAAVVGVP